MTTRLLGRRDALVVYPVLVLVAVASGKLAASSQDAVAMSLLAVLAASGFVALYMLPPRILFLGWLGLAPLLQAANVEERGYGAGLLWGLYLAPGLIMALRTLLERRAGLSPIDLLPLGFIVYVLASLALTGPLAENPAGIGKAWFQVVAFGVVVYYFLTVGPGVEIRTSAIAAVVMASGALQGLIAMVEWRTGWNPWADTYWHTNGGAARSVGTLANPALLGMFLGIAVIVALAVLGWGAPRSLRKLALLTLVLGIPGLFVTLTRGPILATVLVGLVVLLLGPRTRWIGLGAVIACSVALYAALPALQSSDVYQERVSDRVNVQARVALQDWSLRLAEQKPVFGWGSGSFDRVKNQARFPTNGVPIAYVLQNTSHNAYLTILVELGIVGLLLLIVPWLVMCVRGVLRAREGVPERWALVMGVGAVGVVLLSSATYDLRFFSFAFVLPWLFVALLRRETRGL